MDHNKSDEDEDEETLRLKLAAIQAKLRLKKLQQNKAKSQADSSGVENAPRSANPTLSDSQLTSRSRNHHVHNSALRSRESAIEVPISPTKKPITLGEQRSPGRVLLGIDKGVKGRDVSLRRARNTGGGTTLKPGSRLERPSLRSSAFSSIRTTTSSASAEGRYVKSFSERMAESRSVEKTKEEQRSAATKQRSTGFRLNQAEMDSLRLAAQEARTHNPPLSPTKHHEAVYFRRDDVVRAGDESRPNSRSLTRSRTLPDLRNPTRASSQPSDEAENDVTQHAQASGDASLYEPFSHLHLSTRILPHTFLQRTLSDENYTNLRIPDLLKDVHAPSYELPESIVDYVVFGVVASKSSTYDHKPGAGGFKSAESTKSSNDWEKQWEDGSQNQKKFMVLQLTDLKWSIDLFLFGTALPRYHRLSLGTVIAILNPAIMPPKKGKEDTGAFSLTLHSGDDTVLEIGSARDLGFCKAVKKDGKECGAWVNSAKSEICEWHLNAQVTKAQARRMGVNTGSNANGFGSIASGTSSRNRVNSVRGRGEKPNVGEGRGLLPRQGGQRFDNHTGSHYFIASSGTGATSRGTAAPVYHPDRSAANLLDMDDDPFIAERHLSRDKDARLRKRLVAEEKERTIARDLAKMSSGGAGGEYIRQRLGVEQSSKDEPGSQRSALAAKVGIMTSGSGSNGNGKRTADSVRLSPIKKTRLLTDKGIRHPGRESLGAKNDDGNADEDDELDIV